MKPNFITTCVNCGKLTVIHSSIFDKIENPKIPENPSFTQRRNVNINIEHIRDAHPCVIDFLSLQDDLTSNFTSYFPLCYDCTTIYMQQIRMLIKLFNRASSQIQEKISMISKNLFDSQFNDMMANTQPCSSLNIKKLPGSYDFGNIMPNTILNISLNDDEETTHVRPTSLPSDFCLDPISCPDPHHKQLPILMDLNKNRPKKFCPLLSCFTFRIGSDRLYGTINDLRIGFFKYDQNTIAENNSAFFLLCHLIYHFKNAFNVPDIHVLLYPHPCIIIGEEPAFYFEYPEKKKTSIANDFNRAIEYVITAFQLIDGASAGLKEFSMPPFYIDKKQKTIGGISYVFSRKNIVQWSTAMRFLLVDFKMIQFRSLRSSFHH